MNVLFVDDEPKMLRAIERSLSSLQDQLVMHFSGSATQAWDILENESIDVVVSDMRMPNTDGAEFLDAVSERFPDIARLILSGFNDEDASIRSTASAHRFLAKPIDGNALAREIISVGLGHKDVFVRNVVNSMNRLPSPTMSSKAFSEALSRKDITPQELASMVRMDPAATAKLFQLSNSAFFGQQSVIVDVVQCLEKVGVETLQHLEAAQAFTYSDGVIGSRSDDLIADIQKHGHACAELARNAAKDQNETAYMQELAYMGGLLHVVGRLVFAHYGVDVESPRLGEHCTADDYSDLGIVLLNLWGLPNEIIEAARSFHCMNI